MAQVQVELFPALSSSAGCTGKGVDFIFSELFLHLPHFILMRDGNIIINSFNQFGAGCSPIAMGELGRGGRREGEGGKRKGGERGKGEREGEEGGEGGKGRGGGRGRGREKAKWRREGEREGKEGGGRRGEGSRGGTMIRSIAIGIFYHTLFVSLYLH